MPELETKVSKTGWTTVAFGDVVRQVKDKVNPEDSGLERYIGGEHMDTDDLRIRRWGDIGTGYLGPAFHMRFKPGHVLYGSRRTYLRKVAVADFEGITANTTYVLESADSEVLLPKLLPFIMQTKTFNQFSVRESKGSVNPYVNFSDLARFEFALPPIEEQRRMGHFLESTRALIESFAELRSAADRVLQSALAREFSVKTESMPLKEWCRNLITYGIVQAGPDTPNGVPYIRVSDMTQSTTLQTEGMLRTTQEIADKYERSRVSSDDLVVALRGQVGLTRVVPPSLDGANLTQGTARVSVSAEHSSQYVYWALQSPDTRRQYLSHAKGSTFSEISLEALRKIEVPVRSRDAQVVVAERMAELVSTLDNITRRESRVAALYAAVLNETLGGCP